MQRTLEPQTFTPRQEANEYFEMDHTEVNRQYVVDLLKTGPVGPRVVDLGCGPGGIPIELCRQQTGVQVIATDAEIEMLEIAKREIDIAGLLDRINLEHAEVGSMDDFEDSMADTVISNSLLHHLEHPQSGLQTACRLLRGGGRLFIRDLYRPPRLDVVESLVDRYAGNENENAQQLFRQSLLAALTLEEIRELAGGLGISPEHVQMTSDRHWTIDWQKPA